MEKIGWTDLVRTEKGLPKVEVVRNITHTFKRED
jgi:hypothetical protein